MKIHTKRCKSFLANPELKDLLKNKGRTRYMRKTNNDYVTSDTYTNNAAHKEISITTDKETSITTTTDKKISTDPDKDSDGLLILKFEETANNVISKDIDKGNDSNNRHNVGKYVYNENVKNYETIRSLEKMIVLPGSSSTEDTYDIIQDNSTVIQNVLNPDCF